MFTIELQAPIKVSFGKLIFGNKVLVQFYKTGAIVELTIPSLTELAIALKTIDSRGRREGCDTIINTKEGIPLFLFRRRWPGGDGSVGLSLGGYVMVGTDSYEIDIPIK